MAIGGLGALAEYCTRNRDVCAPARTPQEEMRALVERMKSPPDRGSTPSEQRGIFEAQGNAIRRVLCELLDGGEKLVAFCKPPAGGERDR
ncbi:MAG: hypothetical protein AB1758_22405 [Candidatus Eremiobacterota bacterium]